MNNGRDCPHGRQVGKCDTCDLIEAEQEIARLERVETDLRATMANQQDLIDALENAQERLDRENAELSAQVEHLIGKLTGYHQKEGDFYPYISPAQCLSEIKAQAVIDALNNILSMPQTTHQSFFRNDRYMYVSNRALDDYANQLRQQAKK